MPGWFLTLKTMMKFFEKYSPQQKGHETLFIGVGMSTKKMSREDQELLDAFEAGEFKSDLKEERRTRLAKLAAETIKKDKRINIRISRRDLEALQRQLWKKVSPISH